MFALLLVHRLFDALDRSKNVGILDPSAEVQARASLRRDRKLSPGRTKKRSWLDWPTWLSSSCI